MASTTAEIQAERELGAAYQNIPVVKDQSKAINLLFVSDGISAFGHVWTSGEMLTVERDSASYKTTLGFDGKSWLELDEDEQVARFGRRVYREQKNAAPAEPAEPAPDTAVVFEDPDDAPVVPENTSPETNPLLRKKK